jgi:hypothetical protein
MQTHGLDATVREWIEHLSRGRFRGDLGFAAMFRCCGAVSIDFKSVPTLNV